MKKDDVKTEVIFRKFKNGDVIALFPYEIEDYHANCLSYEHNGQHSAADYWHCIAKSKPAKLNEYTDLFKELESLGYNLKVRQKINYHTFLSAVKAFKEKHNINY